MIKAKLIIYCDGGSNPNPSVSSGGTASGIHAITAIDDDKVIGVAGKWNITSQGYILRTNLKTDNLIKEELKSINLFPADNEENKTIKPLRLGPVTDISYSDYRSTTNNQGEIGAVIYALENIEDLIPTGYEVTDILFLLDSTYVLGYMKKIMLDLIDVSTIETNTTYILRLKDILDEVSNKYSINLGKVKAHSDNLGNDIADYLSTMGIMKRSIFRVLEDIVIKTVIEKDYFKDPAINTDLFFFKQLFNFYPDNAVQRRTYFGLNYKKQSDMGKKITGVTYSILKLQTPNETIDMILNIVRETLGSTYYPYVLLIDNIVNKNVLRNLLRYGRNFLYVKLNPVITIKTMTGVDIAQVMSPPGTSINVMDKINIYDEELDDFLEDKLSDKNEIFDITDLIYETTEKGNNVIKKEILNDKHVFKFKYTQPEYRATTIRLRPRLDLPNRNKLKRYEKLNPIVNLIITRKNYVIEYKTVIKLDDGNVIYSNNAYSNLVVLKHK